MFDTSNAAVCTSSFSTVAASLHGTADAGRDDRHTLLAVGRRERRHADVERQSP